MDYKHKNRSTRSKIEHLKHEKQDYILLFERISEVAQNLLVTYSKTKKDGEMLKKEGWKPGIELGNEIKRLRYLEIDKVSKN